MAEQLRSPERLSVLVVDDHDVVHWGFRLMLTQQPWVERCVSAHSGREALVLAARYRPHVALVDLFIGEESGAEICEQLRAVEPAIDALPPLADPPAPILRTYTGYKYRRVWTPFTPQ